MKRSIPVVKSSSSKKIRMKSNFTRESTVESSIDDHTLKILKIKRLLKERDEARNQKEFDKADELKSHIMLEGAEIIDQKGGPSGFRFTNGLPNKIPPNTKLPVINDESIDKPQIRNKKRSLESTETSITKGSSSLCVNNKSSKKAKLDKKSEKKIVAINDEKSKLSSILNEMSNGNNKSSVSKKDIEIGNGSEVKQNSCVKIFYNCWLDKSNKLVDSNLSKPLKFYVGAGIVSI